MKKLSFILFIFSTSTFAQSLKTKDVLLGTNFNLILNFPDEKTDNNLKFGLGFQPNAEFIVEDNLGINLGLGYDISTEKFKSFSTNKIIYTLNNNTFSARIGFKKYVFPLEKLGFHFGLEGQYFDNKTKLINNSNTNRNQEGNSSFFNINTNVGIIYALKNKLFLTAQVSFLNFNKEIKAENIETNYNIFQANINNPVNIGIKKLIRK